NRRRDRPARRVGRGVDGRAVLAGKRGTVPCRRPEGSRHRLRRFARGWGATNGRCRPNLVRLRAARAWCLLSRGERGRRGGLCGHRTEPALPQRRPRRELARTGGAARAAFTSELELPAAAVDVARALDRAEPPRCRDAPGRARSIRTTRTGGTSRQAPVLTPPTAVATRRRASTAGAPPNRGGRSRAGCPSRCRRCPTRSSPPTVACSPASPTVSSRRAVT